MKIGKELFIKLFPGMYRRRILDNWFSYSHYQHLQRQRLSAIRQKKTAEVVFILSNLAMWRLESVCRLLKSDSRFHVHLVICPFRTFDEQQKQKCVEELQDYCRNNGWDFLDRYASAEDVISKLDPDIIFYPQLYNRLFDNELDCEKNLDRLIAYVPYGLPTVSGDWMYNSRFMNIVWKLYFPTALHLKHARSHSLNRARNMEIVGDPHAADFVGCKGSFPWKKQEREKKKVIWAPHFSIGTDGYLHRASFLWLNGPMWEIAQEFKDEIQFVFKPHPRLLSELYLHPEWGKERADAYYEKWRTGENTQLETGEYIDLFCSSDAMVHDCGSFSAEYHYTGKPVAFVSKDFDAIYQGLDAFGAMCVDLHYHAKDVQSIRDFLRQVVLKGDDPLRDKRKQFRKQYLLPDNSPSFAQSVYESLVQNVFKR